MKKITLYFKRIYRLLFNRKKHEQFFWKDLKNFFDRSNFRYGIFEREKYIETFFEISKDKDQPFYYMIYDEAFHCRVKILESFSSEITSDLFILASHFNNILNNGIVSINVGNQYVEYHLKKDLLVPMLFNDEIFGSIIMHHRVSRDIYAAFQRLIIEEEAPAIIIADLIRKQDERDENKDEETSQ